MSFAEYHSSKRNCVERVHATEDKLLSRHCPFSSSEVHNNCSIQPGSKQHVDNMEKMTENVINCFIIFHTAFDNCLPHKHLTTFLHATMNLVGKSKYQKLRFAILKVAICTVESFDLPNSKLQFVKLKIAICQVENCDLPPLVQKPPKLRHTNFVIMTSF
jgi:hypothetical protein